MSIITRIRNMFRRPAEKETPSQTLDKALPDYDTDRDPAARPTSGYPFHFHPLPHPLPSGQPNRGDELLWVETEIARHADAGSLDEGTDRLLDATIDAKLDQWTRAIHTASMSQHRMARGIHAAEAHYLTVAEAQLADANAQLTEVSRYDDQLRQQLLYP